MDRWAATLGDLQNVITAVQADGQGYVPTARACGRHHEPCGALRVLIRETDCLRRAVRQHQTDARLDRGARLSAMMGA